jgi:hypothetical protein
VAADTLVIPDRTPGKSQEAITGIVHVPEGKGLIKSSRNLIRNINRESLRRAANGFYGIPETEYDRLISKPG